MRLNSGYWGLQGLIRTDRTKRVKEARDEAKKEIDEYRKAKEAEFKKFELEVPRPLSSITHLLRLLCFWVGVGYTLDRG